LPFTKNYQTISTSNYSLNIDDDKIVSYENSALKQVNYSINGDQLSAGDMPLLASFIDYKYPSPNIQFESDFLNTALSEFKYRQLVKKFGIFTLIFFLATLFIGHFVLQHYMTLLAEKQSQYTLSQQTITEVNSLKEDTAIKEKILQTSGINHKDYITKYVATIGNTVLEDITITSLTINPMIKKIKKEEKIDFDLNIINIEGESTNDKSFNDWIGSLKNIEWIKKIDIIEYSRESNSIDVFAIQIKI
jgi:Tfp pilus assembly protein PilN